MRLPPGTPEPPGGPAVDKPEDANNEPPGGRAAKRQADFMERRYPGGMPPSEEEMPQEELPPSETAEGTTKKDKPKRRKASQPKAPPSE